MNLKITYAMLQWSSPAPSQGPLSVEEAISGPGSLSHLGLYQILKETKDTITVFSTLTTYQDESSMDGVIEIPKSLVTLRKPMAYLEDLEVSDDDDLPPNRLSDYRNN